MAITNFKDQTKARLASDRFLFFIVVVSFVSILAQASLILTSWSRLPPQVPLFYSRPWGEAMLTSPVALWILPALTALVCLINFSVALLLVSENQFLVRTLQVTALIVALATLYDSAKIIALLK